MAGKLKLAIAQDAPRRELLDQDTYEDGEARIFRNESIPLLNSVATEDPREFTKQLQAQNNTLRNLHDPNSLDEYQFNQ